MRAIEIDSATRSTEARLHDLLTLAAGGRDAWRRYLLGPFGNKREKRPSGEDEPITPL